MNPTIALSLLMNFSSIMIMMTSTSWMTMWMAFELNMISFIPMMMNKTNTSTAESMMKYFMIQTLGSIMLISAMVMNKTPLSNLTNNPLITLAMLTKLGSFPTFQWLPSVTEGLSWTTLTLLLSTQKIMPLMLLTTMSSMTIMMFAAAMSAMVGSIGGFNQTMTRKLLAYSSITHMGWMLMIVNNKMLIMIYLLVYSLIVMSVILQMKEMSMFSTHAANQKYQSNNLMISMLSLGGLPPLLGFIPKLLSINWITKNNLIVLPPLIAGALINLAFYFNIFMKSLLKSSNSNNLNFLTKKNNSMMLMMPSLTLTFSFLII